MPMLKLFYHFVWSTKERLPLIEEKLVGLIYNTIVGRSAKLGGYVHEIGGMEDHVHVIATLPPTIMVSDYIGQIKGASSYVAAQELNGEGYFAWQAEYGAMSVSESHLEFAIRYVRNQREHHSMKSIHPKMELGD